MFSDTLFLEYFILFKGLIETCPPKEIILAYSCLRVSFVCYLVLVRFSFQDYLRISSFIREKTEL